MARFRKKPVVIEAERWFPGLSITGVHVNRDEVSAYIITREGNMEVSPGDWIITGVKGERYPCKDDIFRLTYEPVDGEWTDASNVGPKAFTGEIGIG